MNLDNPVRSQHFWRERGQPTSTDYHYPVSVSALVGTLSSLSPLPAHYFMHSRFLFSIVLSFLPVGYI